MTNKFTKKSYLTSFTGFAPEWDAEIGCYNINSSKLLFVPIHSFTAKVRTNKTTKEKIIIIETIEMKENLQFGNAIQTTLVLQPKDFIIVEGGIAVRESDYMRNKLQYLPFTKIETLKFDRTGYEFMWIVEEQQKELNKIEENANFGGNN